MDSYFDFLEIASDRDEGWRILEILIFRAFLVDKNSEGNSENSFLEKGHGFIIHSIPA